MWRGPPSRSRCSRRHGPRLRASTSHVHRVERVRDAVGVRRGSLPARQAEREARDRRRAPARRAAGRRRLSPSGRRRHRRSSAAAVCARPRLRRPHDALLGPASGRPRTSSRPTSSCGDRTPSTTILHRFPYTRPGSSMVGSSDPFRGRCSLGSSTHGRRRRSWSPAAPRWFGSMSVISLGNGRSTTLAIRASRSWPTTRPEPERRLRSERSVLSARLIRARALPPMSSRTSSSTCVERRVEHARRSTEQKDSEV